jgi:pyridoxal 5'-phosphate synthase pdxT subunit
MAIVGERWGLFPKLREWVADKKPIWGTCAGMILLSDHAIKQAADGQSLVGGLDVHVCRNFFGSQISSCELDINLNSGTAASKDILSGKSVKAKGGKTEDEKKCPAVFIRAPAILSAGPGVEVLASVIAKPHVSSREDVLRLIGEASASVGTSSRTSPSKKQKTEYQVAKTVDETEGQEKFEVFVAVQQGNILATSFHPELTDDIRWHQYFLDMVKHG